MNGPSTVHFVITVKIAVSWLIINLYSFIFPLNLKFMCGLLFLRSFYAYLDNYCYHNIFIIFTIQVENNDNHNNKGNI